MSSKSLKILNPSFLIGARSLSQLPDDFLPEIAVAGRSNVGKSSLLRLFFGNKKLVKVSKTPGKTREINLFKASFDQRLDFRVADLPGYGYAKVSKSLRHEWGKFISSYLEKRKQLSFVLVLIDSRRMLDRGLDDLEISFLEWLNSIERPYAVIFTKIDKIPKTKWGALKSKASAMLTRRVPIILFSSNEGHGLDELYFLILKIVKKFYNN